MKEKMHISRRDFLKSAAVTAGLAASVPLLQACAAAPTATPVPPTATPVPPTPTPKPVAATPTPKPAVATPTPEAKVLLAAPGKPAPAVSPAVEVEFSTQKPEGYIEDTVIKEMVKVQFEAEHPGVKVKVLSTSPATNQAIALRLKEGNPPEVFAFADPRTPGTFAEVWKAGDVYDMTEMYNGPSYDTPGKTVKDTYIQPLIPTMQWEGRFVTAIRDIRIWYTWLYNVLLFEKHGIKEPTTWDEMIGVLDQLKSKAGIAKPIGASMNSLNGWYMSGLDGRTVGFEGLADAFFKTGPNVKENPGFRQSCELFNQLKEYFIEGWSGADVMAVLGMLTQDKVGVLFEATWLMGPLVEFPPTFVESLFLTPAINPDKNKFTDIAGHQNTYQVAAKSKNPALGAEILRWWNSKYAQETRAAKQSQIHFLNNVTWDTTNVLTDKTNKIYQSMTDHVQAHRMISWLEPDLSATVSKVQDAFQIGELSIDGYLDKLAKEIDDYWAKKKAT